MFGKIVAYWRQAHRELIVALLALGCAMVLPAFPLFAERAGTMLQIHLLLELFSVIVAVLIAAVSWQGFDKSRMTREGLLVGGFLAVAAVDLAHALAYDGMPALVSENSTQKAVFFWLAGRSYAVLTLGLLALDPKRPIARPLVVGGFLLLAGLTLWVGLFHLDRVPVLFIPGVGLTTLKTAYEYALLAADLAVAALFIVRSVPGEQGRSYALATSCLVMGLGEVAFAHYLAPSDFLTTFGHLFKIASYMLLYRVVFVSAIRAPYERATAAEQALRESEDFTNRIIDTAPDAIMVIDAAGRIVRANRFAELTFGYGEDEMLGKPVEVLMPERFRDSHVALRLAYSAAPDQRPMSPALAGRLVVGRRRNGSEFAVEAGLGPVEMHHQPHVIVVLRDVTERQEAQAALERINTELEERVEHRTGELKQASQEMATFSYTVAHDLRAPLRSIEGYASMLVEDGAAGEPERRMMLERIVASAKRMALQIDGLLALSRLSRAELHLRPVDLSALARGVVAELRQLEPERSVEVSIAEGISAVADPTLMFNVLQNLLGNAWKYTAKTGRPSIAFGAREQGGVTEYYVADNGAGFEMQYATRLFEVFQRMHRQEEFPGVGIGLATVRRIVERHGGTIRAEADVGQGATFTFTLGGGAAQQ